MTFLFLSHPGYSENIDSLLTKGWNALVIDNDAEALSLFSKAYELSVEKNDTAGKAVSLLNMGICSYSTSYTQGLEYSFRAMEEYKKLEKSNPQKALEGRSRCLQLISTIYSRQGKFKSAIECSREATQGLPTENDSTGTLGLIYNSLGVAYKNLGMLDSSDYYHELALKERLLTRNYTYMPLSYIYVAEIEMRRGNDVKSYEYYERALFVADSTGNRQSQSSAMLGLGEWYLNFKKDNTKAEEYYLKGKNIAAPLTDRYFYLKALERIIDLKKKTGDFKSALAYEEEKTLISDTLNSWEKQRIAKKLEVQFEVSEKDRKLGLMQKEKDIALLTNYILWGTIGFVLIISIGFILFLKRINKRDKQLLKTQEELVLAVEEQKRLKELQMQNELEFKESQLSAMTIQMVQKSELMQELKEQLASDKDFSKDAELNKILNKGQNHDKDWSDFNVYFESLNRNFYSRLKQAYPDISPNDLKICALIKLNLSIKEMANVLNISPDSVKTARYRLRKKLQLNTEDNLTEFILNL